MMEAHGSTRAERLTLSVVTVATILVSAVYLGRQIGKAELKIDSMAVAIGELAGSIKDLNKREDGSLQSTADLRRDFEGFKADMNRRHSALWYYAHGRIDRLPWHPPYKELEEK